MSYREQSDEHEEQFQQAIAAQLGLTVEELDEWVISEEEEFTDDGVLVSHFIEFDKKTPSSILARVGLAPDGPKVKYLAACIIPDDNVPRPRTAEDPAPLKESSLAQQHPSSFPKIMKWLLVSLLVAVGAGVATVAWIMHSLGPMPSFG